MAPVHLQERCACACLSDHGACSALLLLWPHNREFLRMWLTSIDLRVHASHNPGLNMAHCCFKPFRDLSHMLWAQHDSEMQRDLQVTCLGSHCPSTSSHATSLAGSGGLQTYLQTTPRAASSTPSCSTGMSLVCSSLVDAMLSYKSCYTYERTICKDSRRFLNLLYHVIAG